MHALLHNNCTSGFLGRKNTVHESTKCAPNLVMLGKEIMLSINVKAGSTLCNINNTDVTILM